MPKEKYIIKTCRKHGETQFVLEGRGYYRCIKCRSESVSKHRKHLKERAVAYLGGRCQRCGYNKCQEALECHHLYGKDFGVAESGVTRSWEKLRVELDKCELLCANCHREVHTQK